MDRCFIAGLICLVVGSVIASGVFFPRLRMYYKGSSRRSGALTSASFAFLPICWGIMLIWSGIYPEQEIPAFLFLGPFALTAVGCTIGNYLDHNRDNEDF